MGAPPGGVPPGRAPIPEAEILTRRPQISFLTQNTPPPAMLYILPDDQLLVRVHNSVASLTINVRARILLPNGEVIPQLLNIIPATDRTTDTTSLNLVEGFLLSLTVSASGGLPRRGQCFVQVGLGRGPVAGPGTFALLISNYLTTGNSLGWPAGLSQSSLDGPGILRSIGGTDPAAGVEVAESVPTNTRWRVHAAQFSLVTDGAAANRTVRIVVDDGSTTLFVTTALSAQTANLSRTYNTGHFGAFQDAIVGHFFLPLPVQLLLFQGWRFRTATDNLQAGDNFGAPQLLVEEWIED